MIRCFLFCVVLQHQNYVIFLPSVIWLQVMPLKVIPKSMLSFKSQEIINLYVPRGQNFKITLQTSYVNMFYRLILKQFNLRWSFVFIFVQVEYSKKHEIYAIQNPFKLHQCGITQLCKLLLISSERLLLHLSQFNSSDNVGMA